MEGGNGENEANGITLCSKYAYQRVEANYLHGWRIISAPQNVFRRRLQRNPQVRAVLLKKKREVPPAIKRNYAHCVRFVTVFHLFRLRI